MSIEQLDKIDVISIDPISGNVVLDIADHLDWMDVEHHLMLLQDKINAYIKFIESEQIFETHPQAKGHRIMIHVACLNPFPKLAVEFFEKVKLVLDKADIGFSYRHSHFNSPPHVR